MQPPSRYVWFVSPQCPSARMLCHFSSSSDALVTSGNTPSVWEKRALPAGAGVEWTLWRPPHNLATPDIGPPDLPTAVASSLFLQASTCLLEMAECQKMWKPVGWIENSLIFWNGVRRKEFWHSWISDVPQYQNTVLNKITVRRRSESVQMHSAYRYIGQCLYCWHFILTCAFIIILTSNTIKKPVPELSVFLLHRVLLTASLIIRSIWSFILIMVSVTALRSKGSLLIVQCMQYIECVSVYFRNFVQMSALIY